MDVDVELTPVEQRALDVLVVREDLGLSTEAAIETDAARGWVASGPLARLIGAGLVAREPPYQVTGAGRAAASDDPAIAEEIGHRWTPS
jgi:hypothetical protein